jgi:hypothetical protein
MIMFNRVNPKIKYYRLKCSAEVHDALGQTSSRSVRLLYKITCKSSNPHPLIAKWAHLCRRACSAGDRLLVT